MPSCAASTKAARLQTHSTEKQRRRQPVDATFKHGNSISGMPSCAASTSAARLQTHTHSKKRRHRRPAIEATLLSRDVVQEPRFSGAPSCAASTSVACQSTGTSLQAITCIHG
jgi:hypothetical protein